MPGLVLRNFHTGSRACFSVSRFPFVTQDRESEPTTEPQSYFIFRVGLGLAPFSTRPARHSLRQADGVKLLQMLGWAAQLLH